MRSPPVAQVAYAGKGGEVVYLFGAVRSLKQDANGRIIEFRSWPALCGPPRTPQKGQPLGTAHPFAGMTMDEDGNNCVAHAADAVRSAARLSAAFADPNPTLPHWVRDAER